MTLHCVVAPSCALLGWPPAEKASPRLLPARGAGINVTVIRSSHRVLACVALVLASILLGPHGAEALLSGEHYTSDAAPALDDAERSKAQLGGETEDNCPPGCDCPCCGSPIVSATASRISLGPVGSVALAVARDGSRSAPAGERGSVFRPPRA